MMDAAKMIRATRGGRRVLLGGVVALAATLGTAAWAQPASAPGTGYGMGQGQMGQRHMGHGHMGQGMSQGHGMGGMMLFGSPKRIDRAVDRMLDGLNASDAQRSQIKQIAQGAASDLKAQFAAGKKLREQGLQLFAAPTIDTAAVEALRQQMLAQHDQASKRVMQALLDIGQVLTPEQRAKFVERIELRKAQRQDRLQRMQRHQPAGK
jgi:Spy/CpxP family protein refolding chaperone